MLSLIFTALLGLFCYSGSIDNRLNCYSNFSKVIMESTNTRFSTDSSISTLSGECSESFVFSDFRSSPVSKNAFVNEDGGEFEYVFTFSDIMNTSAFLDIRDFFNVNGFDITNMAYQDIYRIPLQLCYMGNAQTFDYAAGYPFNITETWVVNYIGIIYINDTYDGNIQNYGVFFHRYSDEGVNSNFLFRYSITKNFDYVVNCYTTYQGQPYSSGLDTKAFVGDTEYGSRYFPKFVDIFPSVRNRNTSVDYYNGYSQGYDAGKQYGEQIGYSAGYAAGTDVDATASTIFTGILDVALIPVNVFLTIFNFQVFGINIAGIVSALLTISVVVIIIRFVTGKKDD